MINPFEQLCFRLSRRALRDKRVLDFGSGSGELSRLAWELGAQWVIGVDLSEKFVEFAREATAPHGLGDKAV